MTYYTIYDNKTDEILAFGNAVQCSQMLGKTVSSLFIMVSEVAHKRNDKYAVAKKKL